MVFNSHQKPGTGEAVYMAAAAGEPTGAAAGYLMVRCDGDLARHLRVCRMFSALQARDRALATGDPKLGDSIADLLTATADLAGRAWPAANTDDPDLRRLTAALRDGWRATSSHHHVYHGQTPPATADIAHTGITELDELLSRVLWSRYRPP
jgi:hypothetical protein